MPHRLPAFGDALCVIPGPGRKIGRCKIRPDDWGVVECTALWASRHTGGSVGVGDLCSARTSGWSESPPRWTGSSGSGKWWPACIVAAPRNFGRPNYPPQVDGQGAAARPAVVHALGSPAGRGARTRPESPSGALWGWGCQTHARPLDQVRPLSGRIGGPRAQRAVVGPRRCHGFNWTPQGLVLKQGTLLDATLVAAQCAARRWRRGARRAECHRSPGPRPLDADWGGAAGRTSATRCIWEVDASTRGWYTAGGVDPRQRLRERGGFPTRW